MGERIRLPNGRIIVLPYNVTPEQRSKTILELKSRFRIDNDYVPPPSSAGGYTELGAMPSLPSTPQMPGMPGMPELPAMPSMPGEGRVTPPTRMPAIEEPEEERRQPVDRTPEEFTGERTWGGGLKTLLTQGIPAGFQQAALMAKSGVLGAISPGRDTEAEKANREALEELIYKIDPAYRDSHWAELGMALGTMGGFAATPLAVGAVTVGAPVIAPFGVGVSAATLAGLGVGGAMGLGEGVNRMARHEEITGEDISGAKEAMNMLLATGIGFTEMAPLGRVLRRVQRLVPRHGVAKTVEQLAEEALKAKKKTGRWTVGTQNIRLDLGSMGRQALEEAAQEAGAGIAQSAIALSYDEDAMVGASAQAIKEALLGGEVGGIMDFVLQGAELALGGRRRRSMERMLQGTEMLGEALDEGIDSGTINFDNSEPLRTNEEGQWADQSERSVAQRDHLRFEADDGSFVSPHRRALNELHQELLAKIQVEEDAGRFDKNDAAAARKSAASAHQNEVLLVVNAGARIAEIETGINPLKERKKPVPKKDLPPIVPDQGATSRTEYKPDGRKERQVDVAFETRETEGGAHVPDGVEEGDTITMFNIKGERVPVEVIAVSPDTGAIRFRAPDGTEHIMGGEYVLDDINNPNYVFKTTSLEALQGRPIRDLTVFDFDNNELKDVVLPQLEERLAEVSASTTALNKESVMLTIAQDINAVKATIKRNDERLSELGFGQETDKPEGDTEVDRTDEVIEETSKAGEAEATVEKLNDPDDMVPVTIEEVVEAVDFTESPLKDAPRYTLAKLRSLIWSALVPQADYFEGVVDDKIQERQDSGESYLANLRATQRHIEVLRSESPNPEDLKKAEAWLKDEVAPLQNKINNIRDHSFDARNPVTGEIETFTPIKDHLSRLANEQKQAEQREIIERLGAVAERSAKEETALQKAFELLTNLEIAAMDAIEAKPVIKAEQDYIDANFPEYQRLIDNFGAKLPAQKQAFMARKAEELDRVIQQVEEGGPRQEEVVLTDVLGRTRAEQVWMGTKRMREGTSGHYADMNELGEKAMGIAMKAVAKGEIREDKGREVVALALAQLDSDTRENIVADEHDKAKARLKIKRKHPTIEDKARIAEEARPSIEQRTANLEKETQWLEDPDYRGELLAEEEDRFFGPEAIVDLDKLVERLPYQLQRDALKELESSFRRDPELELSGAEVGDVVRAIFSGGLNEDVEIVRSVEALVGEHGTWVPYEDVRVKEPTTVARARPEPEIEVPEFEIVEVTPAIKAYDKGLKKGSKVSPSVRDEILAPVKERVAAIEERIGVLKSGGKLDGKGRELKPFAQLTPTTQKIRQAAIAKEREAIAKEEKTISAIKMPGILEHRVSTEEAQLRDTVLERARVVADLREGAGASLHLFDGATTLYHELRQLRKPYRSPEIPYRERTGKLKYSPEDLKRARRQRKVRVAYYPDIEAPKGKLSRQEGESQREFQARTFSPTPIPGKVVTQTWGLVDPAFDIETGEYIPNYVGYAGRPPRIAVLRTQAQIDEAIKQKEEQLAVLNETISGLEGGPELVAAQRELDEANTALTEFRTSESQIEDRIEGRDRTEEVSDFDEHVRKVRKDLEGTGVTAVRVGAKLKSRKRMMVERPVTGGGVIRKIGINAEQGRKRGRLNDPVSYDEAEVARLERELTHEDTGKTKKHELRDDFLRGLNTPGIVVVRGARIKDDKGRDVQTYDVIGGANLFEAAKRKGRTTASVTLVKERLTEERLELGSEGGGVLAEMYDTPMMIRLGMWLDRHGVDKDAIKEADEFLALAEADIYQIRRMFLGLKKGYKKGEVTRSLLLKALEAKGFAMVDPKTKLVKVGKVTVNTINGTKKMDFIAHLIENTFGRPIDFTDLLPNEKILLLERILSSKQQTVLTTEQKPLRRPSGLTKLQQQMVIEEIKKLRILSFNPAGDLPALVLRILESVDPKPRKVIYASAIDDTPIVMKEIRDAMTEEVMDFILNHPLIKVIPASKQPGGLFAFGQASFKNPKEMPKVIESAEQVKDVQKRAELKPRLEEGAKNEAEGKDDGGTPVEAPKKPWRNPITGKQVTEEEKQALLERARKRIDGLLAFAQSNKKQKFGTGKKAEEWAIRIEATLGSIYEGLVKTVANRNEPAYVDTYDKVIVLNISQLEDMYKDDYKSPMDVPIRRLAAEAMAHEGAHVYFMEGLLTPQQKRNLKLYGSKAIVPKEVDLEAHEKNQTWRQWIESRPGYDKLSPEEVTEEMSVQLIDALARGRIPEAKTSGAMNAIKRKIWDTVEFWWNVNAEGSLRSIMSVFDVVQDNVEMQRRLDIYENQELRNINLAERADPNLLKNLMTALEKGDKEKAKEFAREIVHQTRKTVDPIDPTQAMMNELRARVDIDNTPNGYLSTLNGGALEDGVVSPAALNEFFSIEDGNTPFVMGAKRRQLLGRRRVGALTQGDEEQLEKIKERRKAEGIEDEGPGGAREAIEDLTATTLTIERARGKGAPVVAVTPDDMKKVWEYNTRANLRMRFLDRRLPQALSSLRANARRKALGLSQQVDAITSWRMADNAQNYLPALWELGPIERTKKEMPDGSIEVTRGFDIVQGREVVLSEEKVIVQNPDGTFEELTLTKAGVITTQGLHPIFEPILDESTMNIATSYGEGLRILATRSFLNDARRRFEQEFKVMLDRAKIDMSKGDNARLGGLRLDKQGNPEFRPIAKGSKDQVADVIELYDQIPDEVWESLTPLQESRFHLMVDGIGLWQRRYDRVLAPGEHPKSGLSQNERYDWLVDFVKTTQEEGDRVKGSASAAVLEFWTNYRAYNDVLIDMAFDSELINEERKRLYKSMNFMPFYRDQTGWEGSSVFENANSPEAIDIRRRMDLAELQRVASGPLDRKGDPLIDKNIEGTFMPIDRNLMSMILKNVQALIRDSMWNTAADATVEEGLDAADHWRGIDVPETAEQVFIYPGQVTRQERILLKDAGFPLVRNEKSKKLPDDLTEEQARVVYGARGLRTPRQLDEDNFTDMTIRIKKKGEYKYYRTTDPNMAQAVMLVGVSPSQTLKKFFQTKTHMSDEWAERTTKLLIGSSNLLRTMVTLSPVFWGKNVLRDSMQAKVSFGHGWPLVFKAFGNFLGLRAKGKWVQEDGKAVFKKEGDPYFESVEGKKAEAMGAYERARRAGLAVGIDFHKDPKRAHEQAMALTKQQKLEWDTPFDLAANLLWRAPIKGLKRGAAQSEIATRLAVYDVVMEDTNGNQAEAFRQALEIINFGRRGSSAFFGALTAMSPFINGRIQGFDVMWREHIGAVDVPGLYPTYKEGEDPDYSYNYVNPDEALTPSLLFDPENGLHLAMPSDYDLLMRGEGAARRRNMVFQRAMGIVMLTMLYYAWRRDDDDYKNAREDEKNNHWLLPSGMKIPIPFEVGVLYKVIPEQILRWLTEEEHDIGDVSAEAKRQIYASMGYDLRPQALKNFYDAMRNIDRYQRDNIVPQWMADDLISGAQVRDNTSLVARGLAGVFDSVPLVNSFDWLTSPMKMEYILRQQFGTMGAYAITSTDALIAWSLGGKEFTLPTGRVLRIPHNRAGTPYNFGISSLWAPFKEKDVPLHERLAHLNRVPILGDLIFDPREGGGYQEDFYEIVETLDAVVTTLGQYEARGQREKAQEFEEEHDAILKHQTKLRHWETQMDHWRDDRDKLLARTTLTREEKSRDLIRLIEQRDDMLEGIEEIMADIRRDRSPFKAALDALAPEL